MKSLVRGALFCVLFLPCAPIFSDEPSAGTASNAQTPFFSKPGARALEMDRPDDVREAVRIQASDALASADYDYLERTEKELQTKTRRETEGTCKIPMFLDGLGRPAQADDAAWQKHFQDIAAWQKARPDSTLPDAALGESWAQYAVDGRNFGGADTTTSEGQKQQVERLAQARKILEDAYAVHHGRDISPSWYLAMQHVAFGQMWARADYDKIFDEAVAAYPDCEFFYFHKANYILPDWVGAAGDSEKFAEESAKKQGPILYTRIMWSLSGRFNAFNFFNATGAKWDLMKTGFEAMRKEWPTSLWNVSAYCHFAVMANDKATAKRLFDEIGSNVEANIFGSADEFNAEKVWAYSPGANSAFATDPTPWPAGTAPSSPTDASSAPLLVLDRPGQMKTLKLQARDALVKGDFDYLERVEKEYCSPKSRLPEGAAKRTFLYGALTTPWDSGADAWPTHLALLEAWQKARPDSTAAPSVLALALTSYAWVARGGGFADTITPQGQQLMDERLTQARKILEDTATAHQGKDLSPAWYHAMQLVALGQGWTLTDYEKLFNEAVSAYPDNEEFYESKAYYLLPKWYGQPGDAARFAEDCGNKRGQDLYTRIMWYLESNYGYDAFFTDSGAQWPLMKAGFEKMEKDWPTSLWNLNNFCRFAVAAKDKPTAKRLFDKIGINLYINIWDSPDNFYAGKAWANAPGP